MEPEFEFSDATIIQKLQELQKLLNKKQHFEESVSSIRSLFLKYFPSASPSVKQSFYSVVARVATILKTRHTAPGFWNTGLQLFLEAEQLVSDMPEKKHLQSCISQAREQLHEIDNQPDNMGSIENRASRGFLFEGHLTVDQEPAQPQWMLQENMMMAVAALHSGQSSEDQLGTSSTTEFTNILQDLVGRLDDIIPQFLDDGPVAPKVPPASKEVVAKLPVSIVSEEMLKKLGADAECAICKENLIVSDSMQELPCKHMFHPPCLKPWLDEHNSCPICRHELQTDDHAYESRKEREREAEEERKGAANAVREGEYMYV